MSGLQNIKRAAPFSIRYNTDSIMDNFSGRWQLGTKGEYINNGGVATFTGAIAGPNMYKSTILASQQLMVLEHYPPIHALVFECEGTGEAARWQALAKRAAPTLAEEGIEDHPRVIQTNLDHYSGNEIWEEIKGIYRERVKNKEKLRVETPLADRYGKPVSTVPPIMFFIDSLTSFRPEAMDAIQNKGEIGESGQNMLFMKGGIAKSQMLDEAPTIMHRGGLFILATAQLGAKFDMGQTHALPPETLRHMAENVEMKGTSRHFKYLPNNLFWIAKTRPLLVDGKTSSEKLPRYPIEQEINLNKDTDLMSMTVVNVRGKSGPSGMPIDLIFSQREGFLKYLTDYDFISNTKYEDGFYGMDSSGSGGSIRRLHLYPDVPVGRTNIREKLDTDPLLRRACQITRDLLMFASKRNDLPDGVELCSPKELYDDIKSKGYDWHTLLATRGYWTFDQYEHPIPFLSTVDLLRMRMGLYHPYWMAPK